MPKISKTCLRVCRKKLNGYKLRIGLLLNVADIPILAMFRLNSTYVEVISKMHFMTIFLTQSNAMNMIKQIESYPPFLKFRGKGRKEIERCINTILRLIRIQLNPTISDIGINPVFTFEQGNDVLRVDV